MKAFMNTRVAAETKAMGAFTLKHKGRIAMNRKQIKKYLIDNDLTITGMARQLASKTTASESSIRQMLTDMFYQRRWYPSLAALVDREYGLRLVRPEAFEPKVRLKHAA
jgi:uncharacterized protein YneF (UPF0154 family)